MSVPLGAWQQAYLPPPPPPPPPAVRRGRGTVVVLVAALVIATLAAAGVVGTVVVSGQRAGLFGAGVVDIRRDDPDDPDPGWDPRVLDLVAFVEGERGLEFDRPVKIDFLDEEAFRKEVTDEEAPDETEQAELKSAPAMLRAVGLLSGDVDLLAASNELAGDGVAGFYSSEDERIVVRGGTLDDEHRSTLVHELTHALQDQHFDLAGTREEMVLSGELAAFEAVVEGDATAVADAWAETLPSAAQEALRAAEQKSGARADFKGVPPAFIELTAFPYAFGPDFLEAVIDVEGDDGRDDLFTTPPSTEEHILLPDTYLDGDEPEEVDIPALAAGEEVVEDTEGDMGMLSLLVMLSERIDFGVAWPAVQGWAGDSFVSFERGGTICVRSKVVFDEPAQAERFANAFASWSKGKPASHTRDERSVTFESCDPGAAASGGRQEGHVSGIQGLDLRRQSIIQLEGRGLPPEAAACIVDGVLEKVGADRVAQLERAGGTPDLKDPAVAEVQRTMAELATGCR